MYKKILVALEHGPADEELLAHVVELAKKLQSDLLLLHVAEGFAARNFDQLALVESEEMAEDRAYLEREAAAIRKAGINVHIHLALGNPPEEILKAADTGQCDLIAMGSHGHRLIGDLIYGSTIYEVRHTSQIPLLIMGLKPHS